MILTVIRVKRNLILAAISYKVNVAYADARRVPFDYTKLLAHCRWVGIGKVMLVWCCVGLFCCYVLVLLVIGMWYDLIVIDLF